MPTVLDLLLEPEFADDRLTETINIAPYTTGRPAQLGIFVDRPIATTYARIGIKDGQITIIPARERGGPSNKNMERMIKETLVPIPHFPLDDKIGPSDLQNLHAFGEPGVFRQLATVVNDKLTDMRTKHDETHKHLDWGALNGLILDAEGKVLLNVFDHFEIAAPTYDMKLDVSGTDVAEETRTVKALVRKALGGAAMTGLRILAGANFHKAYVGHASVSEAYKYFAGGVGQNPNRDALDDGFAHGGAVIERVDEDFTVRLATGALETRAAVDEDEAIVVPLGTQYGRRYIAPPDTIFDANQAPDPANKVFVSTDDLPHGKGREIHTESNILPVFLRPQALIRLTI